MKKYILVAAAAVSLASCSNAELERSNYQKDSLLRVVNQKEIDLKDHETSLNEFVESFNEVERNLDSVSARQQIIYVNSDRNRGDFRANRKEKLNQQIKAINDLMDSNRQTIAELRSKLRSSGKKNARLEKLVATLNEQIAQKDQELAALNDRLNELNVQVAQLNTVVDTLKSQNSRHTQTIASNIAAMHTAYYVVGRAKDLEKSRLIDRKGGLLGLGKTSRPSGNFNDGLFTRIDYTQTSTIPVNSRGVKIVSSHPAGSYRLENDPEHKKLVKNIVITDAEKFWSTSKYLVVEGDPVKQDKSVTSGEKPADGKY